MKRMLSILIVLVLCTGLMTACGQTAQSAPAPAAEEPETAPEAETPAEPEAEAEVEIVEAPAAQLGGVSLGGWTASESPELDDELLERFAEATGSLLGVNYEPLACLGTQPVAGTNYVILCKAQVVAPNTVPAYALVYFRVDPEGAAELIGVLDMTAYGEIVTDPAAATELAGGWAIPENDEAGFAALEKAVEGLVGAQHTPIRVLGRQVVAGTNYSVLCRSAAVTPDAVPYYTIAVVYEDLDGNAEITRFVDLDGAGQPVAEAAD